MQLSTFARRLVATVFLLGLIALSVFAIRWQSAIDDVIRPSEPEPVHTTVRLYFADGDAQCLHVEPRTLALDSDDVHVVAMAALAALADGPQAAHLWPTIPSGARVLSLVIENDVATVDYSAELRTNHGGGSAGETLTVASIVGTLSEFPDVDAVQILLENEVQETLVGHLSLTDPRAVDPEALRLGTICWDGIH